MLRVAAVTQEVCRQVDEKLSIKSDILISVSLLHNLGNLVKFDITLFPRLFEPEWVEYWKQQKNQTVVQHGLPAKSATIHMCKELSISSSIQILLEWVLTSHYEKYIDQQAQLLRSFQII